MKYLFSAIFALALMGVQVQAQTNERKAPVTVEVPAKAGTYQFVYRCRSAEEQVSLSLVQLIRLEQLRDQTRVKLIQYSEKTLIKLLPKTMVENPSYIAPATDKVYIVEEVDFYNYSNLNPEPLF